MSDVNEQTAAAARAGGSAGAAENLARLGGLESSMTVMEVGSADDVDLTLHDAVTDYVRLVVGADSNQLVDAVLLWYRNGDGDLATLLADVTDSLVDGGVIWLLTPHGDSDGFVYPADIKAAAAEKGLRQSTSMSNAGDHWYLHVLEHHPAERAQSGLPSGTIIDGEVVSEAVQSHNPRVTAAVRAAVAPYGADFLGNSYAPDAFTVRDEVLDASRDLAVESEVSTVVFLDTDDEDLIAAVLERLRKVIDAAGYGGEVVTEVLRGSIFRRAKAYLTRGLSSAEVTDRLIKLERAAELAYLDTKQAEVDNTEATAVQLLLESVKEIDRVCMRVGSILLVKFVASGQTVTLVRNLSQIELRALERYPEIQAKPERVFAALATAVESFATINATDGGDREIAGETAH